MNTFNLFAPPAPAFARMAKARKEELVKHFLREGLHWSPSGNTAAIVIQELQKLKAPFTVTWDAEAGYVVKKGA